MRKLSKEERGEHFMALFEKYRACRKANPHADEAHFNMLWVIQVLADTDVFLQELDSRISALQARLDENKGEIKS